LRHWPDLIKNHNINKPKHLAGYLPYELKGIMYYGGCVRENVELGLMDIPVWLNGSYPIKPILHPLSDLTKEIEVNGEKFVPLTELLRLSNFDVEKMDYKEQLEFIDSFTNTLFMTFDDGQKLLEWHFDIYGLIPSDLAIDINTLK